MSAPKTNPKNDRKKREYLIWLKEAKQRSPATVEQVRHALDRFESYSDFDDYGAFNIERALGFKRALLATVSRRSGKPITIATVLAILQAVKEFLAWLQGQDQYRRRIVAADIAYLNLTAGEERQARTTRPKMYASLEEYRSALFAMPCTTEAERRDQAVLALLLLACMRDGAVIGLKLRHIAIERRYVFQDPRDMRTKFSKPIHTIFFPVGEDVVAILENWLQFLAVEKGFNEDDPLFPKLALENSPQYEFRSCGLSREHWANAAPIRRLFKSAFARVGLPYVKPHTVRDTLTQLGYRLKLSPEQLKAWSQNMGHDKPLTTLNSYGHVTIERQTEIMMDLSQPPRDDTPMGEAMADRIAEMVVSRMKKKLDE